MIREAEIIVRAHVEDAFAASDGDVRVLRRNDDALGFVKALRLYFIERLRKLLFEFGEHKTVSVKERAMQKWSWTDQFCQPLATRSGTFSPSFTPAIGSSTTSPDFACAFRKEPISIDQNDI